MIDRCAYGLIIMTKIFLYVVFNSL